MARWRWRRDDALRRRAGGGGRERRGWRGFEAGDVELGAAGGVLRPRWVPTIGLLRKLLVDRRREKRLRVRKKRASRRMERPFPPHACLWKLEGKSGPRDGASSNRVPPTWHSFTLASFPIVRRWIKELQVQGTACDASYFIVDHR